MMIMLMVVVIMVMIVMMVLMVVVMVVVAMLAVEDNINIHHFDLASLHLLDVQCVAAEIQLLEFFSKYLLIYSQIQKCSQRHVAADTR